MNYNKTIDNKKIFTRPDGQQVVDLTQQNFNPKSDITIFEIVSVPKDFEMRPDLVAKSAYSSLDSTELILKQAGISNPFTLQEGDFIFLQEFGEIQTQFGNSRKEEAAQIVRNQYIDSSKTPTVDQNLKKFEKREKPKAASPKKSGSPLPPNFSQEGEQEIKLVGGKVIYGGDVTKSEEELETPLSKSEYLAKLIKAKKLINP
jgi:hypothetical protein